MSFALSVVSECPLSEGADCRQLREIGRFPYSLADALSLVCPYIITPFDCVCQVVFLFNGEIDYQSALTKDTHSICTPLTKQARQPHFQKNHLPPKTKNFPHVPATSEKRNKIPFPKWRGHGGSSGWVREVWRVGRAPFKGSPCPPNLPDPPRTSPQDPAMTRAKIWFAF